MKYFGIPKCPYCKKRINIIRVWRLKKRGEYICPRCKGISNIFHSPLIYALALLCCAAGFLVYFFERYITNTVDLNTVLKVLIPFVVFYFFSLFMIYLEKPVIKKVFRREDGKLVDENGEVVNIAVNTILSSGGKKVKNTIKNPANGEIMDLKNNPDYNKTNDDFIRRANSKKIMQEETENINKPQVKREAIKTESKPVSKSIADENPATVKRAENVSVTSLNQTEKRSETKYTDEDLNKLEKASNNGIRDNGQKTIRSRYQNESEFDEIFGATQEISDKRLKSARVKNGSSIATPSIATPSIKKENIPSKSEVNVKESAKKETKRFRDL